MHGLIFETSVCYWQNQPGCYLQDFRLILLSLDSRCRSVAGSRIDYTYLYTQCILIGGRWRSDWILSYMAPFTTTDRPTSSFIGPKTDFKHMLRFLSSLDGLTRRNSSPESIRRCDEAWLKASTNPLSIDFMHKAVRRWKAEFLSFNLALALIYPKVSYATCTTLSLLTSLDSRGF